METTTKKTKKIKVKTIDIIALEWFDRVNGNSYFAATITVNHQLKNEQQFVLPFQYGYSDQYKHEALNLLVKAGLINTTYHMELKEAGIIVRAIKHENCKKHELTCIK